MASDTRHLSEVIDEYYKSAGYDLYMFIRGLDALWTMQERNHSELVNHINKYEKEVSSSGTDIRGMQVYLSKTKRHNRQVELLRLLHNYCATLYTIEQNVLEFLGEYRNTRPNDGELAVLDEFKGLLKEPARLFFFAIRNYFTHHEVPSVKIGIQYSREQLSEAETGIISRGRFSINKSFFLSDLDKVNWDESGAYKSKFLKKSEYIPILRKYISREFKGLDIEIMDILLPFRETLHNYLHKTRGQSIEMNKAEYMKTKKLIDYIQKVQENMLKEESQS